MYWIRLTEFSKIFLDGIVLNSMGWDKIGFDYYELGLTEKGYDGINFHEILLDGWN